MYKLTMLLRNSIFFFFLALFLINNKTFALDKIEIIAVVNGNPITSEEIKNSALSLALARGNMRQINNYEIGEILDIIITRDLILAEGDKRNIKISDEHIQYLLKERIAGNNEFLQKMTKDQLFSFRENLKKEIKSNLILKDIMGARKYHITNDMLKESEYLLPFLLKQEEIMSKHKQQEEIKNRISDTTSVMLREIKIKEKVDEKSILDIMSNPDDYCEKNGDQVVNLGWLNVHHLSDVYKAALASMVINNISQPLVATDGTVILIQALKWRNLNSETKKENHSFIQDENSLLQAFLNNEANANFRESLLNDLRRKYLIEIRNGKV